MRIKSLYIYLIAIFLINLSFGCGTPSQKPNRNVIGPITSNSESEPPPTTKIPKIPKDAVVADFNGDGVPFYTHIKSVDTKKGITIIAFENNRYPKIVLPEVHGAILDRYNIDTFDRDLLMITAQLKDPNFNKYFLYVLRNNKWHQVVNGFSIHKSNLSDTLIPITIDLQNPNLLLRHYSVFDLDETSELGYTWRLLQESVPILNK